MVQGGVNPFGQQPMCAKAARGAEKRLRSGAQAF
jgi:hypothetical protein